MENSIPKVQRAFFYLSRTAAPVASQSAHVIVYVVIFTSTQEDSVTVTLTFEPEGEAGLLAKAHARGMDLQKYLQAIVEQEALPSSGKTTISEPTRRQEAASPHARIWRGIASASASRLRANCFIRASSQLM
jgi:hypothetical protein